MQNLRRLSVLQRSAPGSCLARVKYRCLHPDSGTQEYVTAGDLAAECDPFPEVWCCPELSDNVVQRIR
jgi:hypothetical protein